MRPVLPLLLSACVGPCGGAEAPTAAGPTGRLLHVDERGGAVRTVLLDLASGRSTPLATGPGAAFPGPVDPRGELALLIRVEDGPGERREVLEAVDLAEGRPTVLAAAGRVRDPVWSPDGAWVTYASNADGFSDLYRVSRHGGPPERLTDAPAGSFEPSPDPSGRWLAFASSRSGDPELWRVDVDGSAPVQLTASRGEDMRPRVSPLGASIALLSVREGVPRAWLVDPDGSDARPLLPGGVEPHHDLAWSPDGRHLALTVATGPGDLDVLVVDVADGRVAARLGGPGVDEHPAWSSDGAWLAWDADGPEGPVVRVARPDGRDERVVAGPGAWLPRWVP